MNLALTSELTANQLTSWRDVDSGDRFILALGKTRAAAPALSSPTSSSITTDSADIAATIANPNGELLTGHFRHRVQGAVAWETATTSTTTSTALSRNLASLAAGTAYEYEIATDSSFTNKVSGTFSTLEPATITDITVSNIASSTTSVTVAWTNPSAAALTIHPTLTHSGGTIHPSGHNAGTSAGSHTFNVTGLTAGTEYTVTAGFSAGSAEGTASATFTTATTVGITPTPGTVSRTASMAFNAQSSPGVTTVVIVRSNSNIAIAASEPVDCASAVDSIIVAHNGRFFVRGCAQGTSVLTITNQADSSVSTSYTVTSPGLAPMFAEDSYARSVYENSPAGTHVGLPIAAEDEDALAYALSGDGANAFAVDANGQITVVVGATIDYETAASYSLTLTATDTTGGTDTATVVIEVLDLREAELLGHVEIELGNSGDDYGFNTGYGRLVGGTFPGELFGDGNSRTIEAIYEDDDGFWRLVYSGGAAADWNGHQEELDEIMVEVYYEDQRDTRAFVLGGFIEEPNGNTLKLDPPLPSRDWDRRSGEEVAIQFRRHVAQAAPFQAAAITPPPASPNTIVRFVSDTTPGGPEVAQNLIVLIVYGLWAFKKNHNTASLLLGGLILVLTPWVSVIFQMGTPMAAVINTMNLLLGAYVYKYFFEGREQYS